MIPDLRGCPEHGAAEMARHVNRRDSTIRFYCLICRRQRDSKGHKNGPRCYKRGHLKNSWTWRCYAGIYRCLACERERRQEVRRALSKAS